MLNQQAVTIPPFSHSPLPLWQPGVKINTVFLLWALILSFGACWLMLYDSQNMCQTCQIRPRRNQNLFFQYKTVITNDITWSMLSYSGHNLACGNYIHLHLLHSTKDTSSKCKTNSMKLHSPWAWAAHQAWGHQHTAACHESAPHTSGDPPSTCPKPEKSSSADETLGLTTELPWTTGQSLQP